MIDNSGAAKAIIISMSGSEGVILLSSEFGGGCTWDEYTGRRAQILFLSCFDLRS